MPFMIYLQSYQYLKELITDKEEISIDYKWKYLEPILKFIYMGVSD